MAYCTVNDLPVFEGTISLTLMGAWTADIDLPADDGATSLSGAARIALGALTFAGTFTRSGPDGRGRMRARIVGGAGGLSEEIAPVSFLGVPLRTPISMLLNAAGETLSATAAAAVLDFQVPAWSWFRGPARDALRHLVDVVGAHWRVLSDGTVWVGPETWAAASTMEAVPISFEREVGRRTVAALEPSIVPGQTYEGERVTAVDHVIGRSSLRTVLRLEANDGE